MSAKLDKIKDDAKESLIGVFIDCPDCDLDKEIATEADNATPIYNGDLAEIMTSEHLMGIDDLEGDTIAKMIMRYVYSEVESYLREDCYDYFQTAAEAYDNIKDGDWDDLVGYAQICDDDEYGDLDEEVEGDVDKLRQKLTNDWEEAVKGLNDIDWAL